MRCVLVFSSCLAVLTLPACAPEGSSAFVSYNLPVDESCEVTPSDTEFLAVGVYDIRGKGDKDPSNCKASYYTHLLVNSALKSNENAAIGRAEPNVLQLTEAEVRLVDLAQQGTIDFGAGTLPNPFRVKVSNSLPPTTGADPSSGIAVVETIPSIYGPELSGYVGSQVLAEIQVFGTTTGDVDIDFKTFSFAIGICDGCRTVCAADFSDDEDPEDAYGDQCKDDGGQDNRICLDRSDGC